MAVKVTVDQEKCIGCGACVATAPEIFDMAQTDAGDKAEAKKSSVDGELVAKAKEAAEGCPVDAITVSE